MDFDTEEFKANEEGTETASDSFKWDDSATRLLLNLYKKTSKNVGKTIHLKTKQQMWVHIVEELNKYGYNLAPIQARNRLLTLERAYKRRFKNAQKNGYTKRISVYDEEIEAILGMQPTFTYETQLTDNERSRDTDSFQSLSPNNVTTSSFSNDVELNKWDLDTTRLLLEVYNELISTRKFKTKRNMWDAVVEEINERGYNFTAKQARNRLGTLQRAYKKNVSRNKSGLTKMNIPFEREIREIMIKRSTILSESMNFSDDEQNYTFENNNIDNIVIPLQSEPAFVELPEIPLNTASYENESNLTQEIRLLRKEEEQFRNEFLKIHEEKLALMKENNDLLRCLIQKISGQQTVSSML